MDTRRREGFGDGVVAIAITLLVLEISVPSLAPRLGPALVGLWPSYVAYLVSFLIPEPSGSTTRRCFATSSARSAFLCC